MKYVGRDWAVITRKPGSNFLPSKTVDCRILGSGVYILGGGVWWGHTYFGSDGWWWWIFVGWCWVVVDLLRVVVSVAG